MSDESAVWWAIVLSLSILLNRGDTFNDSIFRYGDRNQGFHGYLCGNPEEVCWFHSVHKGEMLQNFKNYFVPLCHSCWLVLFYIWRSSACPPFKNKKQLFHIFLRTYLWSQFKQCTLLTWFDIYYQVWSGWPQDSSVHLWAALQSYLSRKYSTSARIIPALFLS